MVCSNIARCGHSNIEACLISSLSVWRMGFATLTVRIVESPNSRKVESSQGHLGCFGAVGPSYEDFAVLQECIRQWGHSRQLPTRAQYSLPILTRCHSPSRNPSSWTPFSWSLLPCSCCAHFVCSAVPPPPLSSCTHVAARRFS
jgi:hypothetical protein